MIEKYQFDKEELPTLPCPHDCVIEKVEINESFIIFYFDNNISQYDSIQYLRPGSESLIIRYHLDDPFFTVYKSISHITRLGKRFGRHGYYEVKNDTLMKQVKYNLEFLYQDVSYKSVLIRLYGKSSILIHAWVDYVEYEWIERSGSQSSQSSKGYICGSISV